MPKENPQDTQQWLQQQAMLQNILQFQHVVL